MLNVTAEVALTKNRIIIIAAAATTKTILG